MKLTHAQQVVAAYAAGIVPPPHEGFRASTCIAGQVRWCVVSMLGVTPVAVQAALGWGL